MALAASSAPVDRLDKLTTRCSPVQADPTRMRLTSTIGVFAREISRQSPEDSPRASRHPWSCSATVRISSRGSGSARPELIAAMKGFKRELALARPLLFTPFVRTPSGPGAAKSTL
jgi:hypothetical protein